MAVRQLKDGRWCCQYRLKVAPGEYKWKREYFGRGAEAEAKARERNEELGLKRRRPVAPDQGPSFGELAEAYAAAGEKDLAIRNYAKSLQLNPKNTGAIVALNRLNKE